jgi:hypothetical protein
MGRIIHFELEGNRVLGFDTGLDAQAFTQAKLSHLVTQTGCVVSPDGTATVWQPAGVIERNGTMVVWGPDFEGEGLDQLVIDPARKDRALDALRYWLRACILLADRDDPVSACPAGALIAPSGTILFPPERLIRRCIEAEGPNAVLASAERWTHPDLSGKDAVSFSAAALLYRILCGVPPYQNTDVDIVRQDIREGVFTPLTFMVPGLDEALETFITGVMTPQGRSPGDKAAGKSAKKRAIGETPAGRTVQPAEPEALLRLLGVPGSGGPDAYIHPLTGEELQKREHEREQYDKKKGLTVKTRRFVYRNSTILAVALAILIGIALIVQSMVRSHAELPTTLGMKPAEVIETYYGAFGPLDHTLMEACVTNKAGKDDINMVMNLFVISRMRQAYETISPTVTPQEWMAAGSPPTDLTVFGVSDLAVRALESDESDGEVLYRVSYILWAPDYSSESDAPEEYDEQILSAEYSLPVVIPQGVPVTDELRITIDKKGLWHIADIKRQGSS